MSVQDNVERVLREIHVLISKGQPYGDDRDKVVISKKEAIVLLNLLKDCMTDMMDEYEVTERSRDRKEREFQKKGDEIIKDAHHTAEDVYAASVMYSNEALDAIQAIMKDAEYEMERVFKTVKNDIRSRKQMVKDNQLELRASLETLQDTKKYMQLIEARNKDIQKEKERQEAKRKEKEAARNSAKIPMAGQPEIRINPEYFEKTGQPLPEGVEPSEPQAEETDTPITEEKVTRKDNNTVVVKPEIRVNLDAEYFKWKNKETKEAQ